MPVLFPCLYPISSRYESNVCRLPNIQCLSSDDVLLLWVNSVSRLAFRPLRSLFPIKPEASACFSALSVLALLGAVPHVFPLSKPLDGICALSGSRSDEAQATRCADGAGRQSEATSQDRFTPGFHLDPGQQMSCSFSQRVPWRPGGSYKSLAKTLPRHSEPRAGIARKSEPCREKRYIMRVFHARNWGLQFAMLYYLELNIKDVDKYHIQLKTQMNQNVIVSLHR